MKTKLVAWIAVMMMAAAAWAQDTSALHPPAGSRVALVVFEDLQCPACARTDPSLVQAEHDYGIPMVRHDFIIPSHTWSKEAHIMARYFDTQSSQLGEEFRREVFANQSSIYNNTSLRAFADRFAAAHHAYLPAFYDPRGELRAKVEADTRLGIASGVRQTPTIWVVTDSPRVPPVKVEDSSKLFTTIEQVKAELPPATRAVKKR